MKQHGTIFARGASQLPQVLARLGYEKLRKGQDKLIYSLLSGKDTIGILPTGAGKTAAFLIPALCHKWPLLVFSPLQALMRDQCQGLWEMGIRAGRMSGDQTEGESNEAARDWIKGDLEVLFVAPERMQNAQFKEAMRARGPMIVSLDESHIISEWSDNFRPSYAKVGKFIEDHADTIQVVGAFSATLPQEAEQDVRRVLKIEDAARIKYYPRRTNLKLSSSSRVSDYDLLPVLKEINGQTIIYCATQKNTENVASWLSRQPGYSGKVVFFHAGLPGDLKRQNQDDFKSGRAQIITATNAFGMGVDMPNIRGVIHYDMPGTIEALSQESGRAGRDGADSICHAFFNAQSLYVHKFLMEMSNPTVEDVMAVFGVLNKACQTSGEKIAQLYGKEIAEPCGVDDKIVSACIAALDSSGVIEKLANDASVGVIRFPDADSEDERERTKHSIAHDTGKLFPRYEAMITKIGVMTTGRNIRFDMKVLSEQMGVQEATVRANLNKWKREDYIYYQPPFMGNTIRMIGGSDKINQERIKQKRKDSISKLRKIEEYFQVPDEDKHSFLEEYFKDEDEKNDDNT